WHLLFTSRPDELPLNRRQRIRELIRLSNLADQPLDRGIQRPKERRTHSIGRDHRPARRRAERARIATMTNIDATAPDRSRAITSRGPDLAEMIWLPGVTFHMGSDKHYSEEAPVHHVRVDGFWIDRTPVTNRQFRE